MVISIDGPAGSGKSTLSVLLAKHLGFFCLNSGYLYRGAAYILLNFYGYDETTLADVNVVDLQACFNSGKFVYKYEHGVEKLYWDDAQITQMLKNPRYGKAAAIIAQKEEVRLVIRAYKRQLVDDKDAVVEGRVCGSVVFPDAFIKFYVTASIDVRAWRFVKDQKARGNTVNYDEAFSLISARDKADMTRAIDPLIIPVGAIILDTSDVSIQEILDKAVSYIRELFKKHKKSIK